MNTASTEGRGSEGWRTGGLKVRGTEGPGDGRAGDEEPGDGGLRGRGRFGGFVESAEFTMILLKSGNSSPLQFYTFCGRGRSR